MANSWNHTRLFRWFSKALFPWKETPLWEWAPHWVASSASRVSITRGPSRGSVTRCPSHGVRHMGSARRVCRLGRLCVWEVRSVHTVCCEGDTSLVISPLKLTVFVSLAFLLTYASFRSLLKSGVFRLFVNMGHLVSDEHIWCTVVHN